MRRNPMVWSANCKTKDREAGELPGPKGRGDLPESANELREEPTLDGQPRFSAGR